MHVMLMPTYTVLGADMIVHYFSHHGFMDCPSFVASENLVSKNRVFVPFFCFFILVCCVSILMFCILD